MPRVFNETNFLPASEVVTAYANKHTPFVVCDKETKRDCKMKVKVRIGSEFIHPNTTEHYFSYIQLWDLETLIAEARFYAGTFGEKPMQVEVDFYVVPKVSMRLTAHAYCTKHGLWKSEESFVKVID